MTKMTNNANLPKAGPQRVVATCNGIIKFACKILGQLRRSPRNVIITIWLDFMAPMLSLSMKWRSRRRRWRRGDAAGWRRAASQCGGPISISCRDIQDPDGRRTSEPGLGWPCQCVPHSSSSSPHWSGPRPGGITRGLPGNQAVAHRNDAPNRGNV